MSYWSDECRDADYVNYSEKIYELKTEKKRLELDLSEENLRLRYIPKRKNLLQYAIVIRIVLILLIFLFINWSITTHGYWLFANITFGFFAVLLAVDVARKTVTLILSHNTDAMLQFAEEHNLDTMPRQLQACENRIALLQLQIDKIDKSIMDMTVKKKERLDEMKEKDASVQESEKITEEKSTQVETTGFTIKQENYGEQDQLDVYEFFCKEENYLKQSLLRLDAEESKVNREIVQIDENFEKIKKQIFFALIIFFFMIIIQQPLDGVIGTVYGLVCFIACLGFIIYVDRKWKKTILLYFVEHENKLIQDYAFCNGLYPVRKKQKCWSKKRKQKMN